MIRIYNESECITKKNANLYQRNILFFIMHPPGYIKSSNLKWIHEQMVSLPRFKYYIMSLHGLLLSLSLPPGNAIFLENSNGEPIYQNECNIPIQRLCLGHCINHSSKDKGNNRLFVHCRFEKCPKQKIKRSV